MQQEAGAQPGRVEGAGSLPLVSLDGRNSLGPVHSLAAMVVRAAYLPALLVAGRSSLPRTLRCILWELEMLVLRYHRNVISAGSLGSGWNFLKLSFVLKRL